MTTRLHDLLRQQYVVLLEEWQVRVRALRPESRTLSTRIAQVHLPGLFEEIIPQLEVPRAGTTFELDLGGLLAARLRQLVIELANENSPTTDTLNILFCFKYLLNQHLLADPDVKSGDLVADITWVEHVFDRLALFTLEMVVERRERLITEQSQSLLELSTPVLRLWHQVLLLPLVGVIDTVRARQITERLLEAISRYEALVTLIDLTGVPVLDTSVAQHLMKTIDAARLLGTRIVMTGISPEGAQTLTKLGIRFSEVTSRASLRAGIAEAFLLVKQRVVPFEERRL